MTCSSCISFSHLLNRGSAACLTGSWEGEMRVLESRGKNTSYTQMPRTALTMIIAPSSPSLSSRLS